MSPLFEGIAALATALEALAVLRQEVANNPSALAQVDHIAYQLIRLREGGRVEAVARYAQDATDVLDADDAARRRAWAEADDDRPTPRPGEPPVRGGDG